MKAAVVLALLCATATLSVAIHTDADQALEMETGADAAITTSAEAKAAIVAPLAACSRHGMVVMPAAKRLQASRCEVCQKALGATIAAMPTRQTPVVGACNALLTNPAGKQVTECNEVKGEISQRAVELQSLTHGERGGHNIDDAAMGLAYATFMCGKKVLGCCAEQPAPPKETFGKGALRKPQYFYRPYRAIRATTPGFVLGEPVLKSFKLAPKSALHTAGQQQRAAEIIQAFATAGGKFTLEHGNANGGATMIQHELPFPVTLNHRGQRTLKFTAPGTPVTVDEPCEPKDLYGYTFEYWERIRYVWDFYVPRPKDDTARAASKRGILRRIAAGEGGFDEKWKDRFFFAAGYGDGIGCKRSGTEAVWAAIATDAQNGGVKFDGNEKLKDVTDTSFTIDQVDRPGITVSSGDDEQRYFRRDLYFGWTLRKPDGTKIEKAGIQSIELEEAMPVRIKFVTADHPNRPADLDVPSMFGNAHGQLDRVKDADADVAAFIKNIANTDLLKLQYVTSLPAGAGNALKTWMPAIRAGTDLGAAFVDLERDSLGAMAQNCRQAVGGKMRGQPGTAFSNYVILPPPFWAGHRYIQKSCGNACLAVALVRPHKGTGTQKWAIDRVYVTDGVQHAVGPNMHRAHGCQDTFNGRTWSEVPYDHY